MKKFETVADVSKHVQEVGPALAPLLNQYGVQGVLMPLAYIFWSEGNRLAAASTDEERHVGGHYLQVAELLQEAMQSMTCIEPLPAASKEELEELEELEDAEAPTTVH